MLSSLLINFSLGMESLSNLQLDKTSYIQISLLENNTLWVHPKIRVVKRSGTHASISIGFFYYPYFWANAEVEGREKEGVKRSERKKTKKFYERQVDLILIKKS